MKIIFLSYYMILLVCLDVYILFFQIKIIKLTKEISTSLCIHFALFFIQYNFMASGSCVVCIMLYVNGTLFFYSHSVEYIDFSFGTQSVTCLKVGKSWYFKFPTQELM